MSEVDNDRIIPPDTTWEIDEDDKSDDYTYTNFADWVHDVLSEADRFLRISELEDRFNNEDIFSGWADAPEGIIDRDRFGPNYPGGGNEPNLEGLVKSENERFIDRFLSGDTALIAGLAALPIEKVPSEIRPLKELVDRFAANDPRWETDGKKFVDQVKHLLKHFGVKSIPGLGAAIGIVWLAWESWETYKLVENMTLDEFVCMTGDFVVDYGSGAWTVMNGLLNTMIEAINDPTHKDLVETPDGWEFTTPAIPVPVKVPSGGTLYADSTADSKSITWVPGKIDIVEYPEEAPLELPLRVPSWVETDFPDEIPRKPFEDLLDFIDPEDDIDIDIPLTRVQVDALDMVGSEKGSKTDVNVNPGLRLSINLGTQRQNRDEPFKRRKDNKWFGGGAYVKMLWVVNSTWGKASELMDMWNIARKNIYVSQLDLPMNLQQGLRYFLSDGRSQPGFFDYIPIGNLPLSWQGEPFMEQVLEGMIDGSINFSVDFEQLFVDAATEQLMDMYIGRATKAERALINKIFGKGSPLDYGNVSTWLERLGIVDMDEVHTTVLEWAGGLLNVLTEQYEGNYSQCINPD